MNKPERVEVIARNADLGKPVAEQVLSTMTAGAGQKAAKKNRGRH